MNFPMARPGRRARPEMAGPLTLPQFGLGTAGLGNLYEAVSDIEAGAALASARALGFSYLDTAPFYGHGLSEQRLGRYLQSANWQPQLSTKVGRVLDPVGEGALPDHGFADPAPFAPHFDYSAAGVERSFGESCERLGVGRDDILLLHDIGRLTHGADHPRILSQALNEALPAMAAIKARGGARAIGLGVNEWQVCEEVLAHQPLDVILLAGRYTLFEHEDTLGFLNDCAQAGVGVIAGGAFNSGLLASPEGQSAKYDYVDAPQSALERVAALRAVCTRHGVSLPAAALHFCTAHPAIWSVIPGVQNAAHVTDAKGFIDEEIPAALWAELKERGLIAAACPVPQ
mgnify:CR=1 FL=1